MLTIPWLALTLLASAPCDSSSASAADSSVTLLLQTTPCVRHRALEGQLADLDALLLVPKEGTLEPVPEFGEVTDSLRGFGSAMIQTFAEAATAAAQNEMLGWISVLPFGQDTLKGYVGEPKSLEEIFAGTDQAVGNLQSLHDTHYTSEGLLSPLMQITINIYQSGRRSMKDLTPEANAAERARLALSTVEQIRTLDRTVPAGKTTLAAMKVDPELTAYHAAIGELLDAAAGVRPHFEKGMEPVELAKLLAPAVSKTADARQAAVEALRDLGHDC